MSYMNQHDSYIVVPSKDVFCESAYRGFNCRTDLVKVVPGIFLLCEWQEA